MPCLPKTLYQQRLNNVSAVKRLVSVANKLIGHFYYSVVASEALKKEQVDCGVEVKVLLQDCPIRRNSTFYMLNRLQELL